MPRALITGVTGQDGSYLADLLVDKGYEIHGMVRRVALEDPSYRCRRINHLGDRVTLHPGSLESYASIFNIIEKVRPDEIYHLAAQSFVSYSFEDGSSTLNTNINGTDYVLSAAKSLVPDAHVYFAGSSEMFGKVEESPQNEDTPFHPRSPYGISKVAGFDLTRYYREAYDMFAVSGIMFNHESPVRGREFVTRKITSTVARIKKGEDIKLTLGNLEARRDWGYSGDYVLAMWRMLQQETPTDYVVATGKSHTVMEFADWAFRYVGLDAKDYVVVDPKFYRPADVHTLCGDASRARNELGWEPRVEFRELVTMMVHADMETST